MIKMHCRVRYLFDFYLKIQSGPMWIHESSIQTFQIQSILFYANGNPAKMMETQILLLIWLLCIWK